MASRIMASTSGVSPDKGTLLWMFLFEIGIRSIRDLCLAAQFSGQIQKNYFIHSESIKKWISGWYPDLVIERHRFKAGFFDKFLSQIFLSQ